MKRTETKFSDELDEEIVESLDMDFDRIHDEELDTLPDSTIESPEGFELQAHGDTKTIIVLNSENQFDLQDPNGEMQYSSEIFKTFAPDYLHDFYTAIYEIAHGAPWAEFYSGGDQDGNEYITRYIKHSDGTVGTEIYQNSFLQNSEEKENTIDDALQEDDDDQLDLNFTETLDQIPEITQSESPLSSDTLAPFEFDDLDSHVTIEPKTSVQELSVQTITKSAYEIVDSSLPLEPIHSEVLSMPQIVSGAQVHSETITEHTPIRSSADSNPLEIVQEQLPVITLAESSEDVDTTIFEKSAVNAIEDLSTIQSIIDAPKTTETVNVSKPIEAVTILSVIDQEQNPNLNDKIDIRVKKLLPIDATELTATNAMLNPVKIKSIERVITIDTPVVVEKTAIIEPGKIFEILQPIAVVENYLDEPLVIQDDTVIDQKETEIPHETPVILNDAKTIILERTTPHEATDQEKKAARVIHTAAAAGIQLVGLDLPNKATIKEIVVKNEGIDNTTDFEVPIVIDEVKIQVDELVPPVQTVITENSESVSISFSEISVVDHIENPTGIAEGLTELPTVIEPAANQDIQKGGFVQEQVRIFDAAPIILETEETITENVIHTEVQLEPNETAILDEPNKENTDAHSVPTTLDSKVATLKQEHTIISQLANQEQPVTEATVITLPVHHIKEVLSIPAKSKKVITLIRNLKEPTLINSGIPNIKANTSTLRTLASEHRTVITIDAFKTQRATTPLQQERSSRLSKQLSEVVIDESEQTMQLQEPVEIQKPTFSQNTNITNTTTLVPPLETIIDTVVLAEAA